MSESNTTAPTETQELPFQAEVQQVLHLMVHSLYTNTEVFLRELIANASDALDKARFLAVTDAGVAERMGSPEILVVLDQDARTLTIEDNGIGMSRDEIVENLGTIARSGTMEFLQNMKEKSADSHQLIGQFGVGFYSAFTVASRIDVESRSATDPNVDAVLWRSSGGGSFVVTRGERTKPGTRVVVHVDKEHDELLLPSRVESLIKKYSDFVHHPIKLGNETVNQGAALWTRPKAEITDEQYDEFFHHVRGGFAEGKPLARIHFSSDAPIQYHALLFIPDKAPIDLMIDTKKKGIRLYAKRVFVMDGCEQLAPPYLQFLRGVVDSEDLSLNVSREMLQDDRTLEIIRKAIVKQTLKTLGDLANAHPDRYRVFWNEFGRLLRLGLSADPANQEAIAKLLRYPSTQTDGEETTSLQIYIERMPETQKAIYYLTGPSLPALRSSPHLEVFRKKNVEVLLLGDTVDEWVVGALRSFEGRSLESVAHGTVDLEGIDTQDEPDAASAPANQQGLDECVSAIKRALGDQVKDVRLSSRLTKSAACLVSDEGDLSPQMERVMRMLERDVDSPKRILEINPTHPLITNLVMRGQAGANPQDLTVFAQLLLDQALLAEGVVPDPSGLIQRMQQVLVLASASTPEPGKPVGGNQDPAT